MCESCSVPHADDRPRLLRRTVALWLAVCVVGVGLALALRPQAGAPASAGRGAGQTDAVFRRDAKMSAADGAKIAAAVATAAHERSVRAYARQYLRYERRLAAVPDAALVAAGKPAPSGRVDRRTLLNVLMRHSEQDAALARIELSDGRDTTLRNRAGAMLDSERRHLARLASLLPPVPATP